MDYKNYQGYRYTTDKYNQVTVLAGKGEKIDMGKYVSELHKLGREHYDTPSSIIGCACESCNRARKQHGKPTFGWDKKRLNEYGVLECGKTLNELRDEIQEIEDR